MTRKIAVGVAAAMIVGGASLVAQSGHFLDKTVSCTDVGTQVQCSGKVAGLGGTTFEITVAAEGTATVTCTNPGGNDAPGQKTAVTVPGSSGPQPTPTNGNATFSFRSDDPNPLPATPTCPNNSWTPTITDVSFTTATLTLFEDSNVSDTITVNVK
jgi:hypothetical protein